MPLAYTVRVCHDMSILRSKLCLRLLGQLLPLCFFSHVFLRLACLNSFAPLLLLFLLLSLGQLLLHLDLVFALGLLLMLHANGFQCLEAGEARLKWRSASCIIHDSSL